MAFLLGVFAWLVIAGAVFLAAIRADEANEANAQSSSGEEFNLIMMRFKARYLVGVNDLARSFSVGDQQISGQAKALDAGPVEMRLRYAILAGELEGPDEALNALDRLGPILQKNEVELTPEQSFQARTLRRLYTDYRRLDLSAPTVDEKEREQLLRQLDWFGELALAPRGQPPETRDAVVALGGVAAATHIHLDGPDAEAGSQALQPAYRVTAVVLLASCGVVALAALGFLGLAVLAILASLHLLRGGLRCGQSPAGVYAETFALWLVTFEVAGYGLSKLDLGSFRLVAGLVVEVLSLGVLVWPVLRGVPWPQVAEDLGLGFGRRPLADPVIGIGCYVTGFPLMLACLLITAGLTMLLEPAAPSADDLTLPTPITHPVVLPVARGGWGLRLQLLLLASIIAPLVEEIMFRGVLYRHLRELTRIGPVWLSVLSSALFSSFIFAVIHPQGLVAVPVLMGLAIVFALTREWRGTLIPCMVAHGLSNAMVLLLNIGMLAD